MGARLNANNVRCGPPSGEALEQRAQLISSPRHVKKGRRKTERQTAEGAARARQRGGYIFAEARLCTLPHQSEGGSAGRGAKGAGVCGQDSVQALSSAAPTTKRRPHTLTRCGQPEHH